MPQSNDFKKYSLKKQDHNTFEDKLCTRFAKPDFKYSRLQRLLIEHTDSQYGIVSEFKDESDQQNCPTGVCLLRDTTHAKPLDQMPLTGDKHKIIVSNDLLLRMLATTRAIDHLLKQRSEQFPQHKENYAEERKKLRGQYAELLAKVITWQKNGNLSFEKDDQKFLNDIEKNYNHELIKIIHANYFDRGLKTRRDYQELLRHLRYLASTLDPAPTVKTIIRDETHKANHIEIAYPITRKTAKQKASLESLRQIVTNPLPEQINFQTSQPRAMQEANAAFADLILQDNTRLPAQSRKRIPHTVKNGYLIDYRIIFDDNPNQKYQYSTLRSGSIVYVGKGETESKQVEYAKENLIQLQNFAHLKAQKDKIHLTSLITWAPLNNENTIYTISKKAVHELGYHFSSTPLNILGSIYPTQISSHVRKKTDITSRSHVGKGAKQKRLKHSNSLSSVFSSPLPQDLTLVKKSEETNHLKASNLAANDLPEISSKQLTDLNQGVDAQVINLHMCASGQDRTGTADESSKQTFSNSVYCHHALSESGLIINKDKDEIQIIISKLVELSHAAINAENIKKIILNSVSTVAQDQLNTLVEKLVKILAPSVDKQTSVDALRAKAMISPLLATLSAPGSFGMKHDSKPGYFSELTESHFYLKTADTNIQALVDTKELETLLKTNPRNRFAISDLPKYSNIYRTWKNESNCPHFRLADTRKIDRLLKKYKLDFENSYKDQDFSLPKNDLEKIKKTTATWLSSRFNLLFSERVQAVKNLHQNVLIEIQLLNNQEDLDKTLTTQLNTWITVIDKLVAEKTNSTGVIAMHKFYLTYLNGISSQADSSIESKINLLGTAHKIYFYKSLRDIANERLEDNALVQRYRHGTFFGKGRSAEAQALYEDIQQPEFLKMEQQDLQNQQLRQF